LEELVLGRTGRAVLGHAGKAWDSLLECPETVLGGDSSLALRGAPVIRSDERDEAENGGGKQGCNDGEHAMWGDPHHATSC
jgi:hypothetical protein